MRKFIVCLLFVFCLTGCGGGMNLKGNYNLNKEATAPASEVAILKSKPSGLLRTCAVRLYAINGEYGPNRNYGYSSPWDGCCRVELQPGHYELKVGYAGGNQYAAGSVEISFDAEAGHTYWVNYDVDTKFFGSSSVSFFVEDITDED